MGKLNLAILWSHPISLRKETKRRRMLLLSKKKKTPMVMVTPARKMGLRTRLVGRFSQNYLTKKKNEWMNAMKATTEGRCKANMDEKLVSTTLRTLTKRKLKLLSQRSWLVGKKQRLLLLRIHVKKAMLTALINSFSYKNLNFQLETRTPSSILIQKVVQRNWTEVSKQSKVKITMSFFLLMTQSVVWCHMPHLL